MADGSRRSSSMSPSIPGQLRAITRYPRSLYRSTQCSQLRAVIQRPLMSTMVLGVDGSVVIDIACSLCLDWVGSVPIETLSWAAYACMSPTTSGICLVRPDCSQVRTWEFYVWVSSSTASQAWTQTDDAWATVRACESANWSWRPGYRKPWRAATATA